MALFVGSGDPALRQRTRAAFAASQSMSPGLRRDVTRKLGLDEQATSEEIYRAALEKIEKMKAEGARRARAQEKRVGDFIDEAVGKFPSMRSSALGASKVHVIGAALSVESKRLVAMGAAPDLMSAQRLAVARDPSILRR